jgi:hypothetical protein
MELPFASADLTSLAIPELRPDPCGFSGLPFVDLKHAQKSLPAPIELLPHPCGCTGLPCVHLKPLALLIDLLPHPRGCSGLQFVVRIDPVLDQPTMLSGAVTAERSPCTTPTTCSCEEGRGRTVKELPPTSLASPPPRKASFRLTPHMVTDFLQLAWEHRLLARVWYELSRACSLTIGDLIVQWQSVESEIRACLFRPSHDAIRALAPCLLAVPSVAYDCLCVRTSGISAAVAEVFLQHAAKSGTLTVRTLKELDVALQSVSASVRAWEGHHLSNRDLIEVLAGNRLLNGAEQPASDPRALYTLAMRILAIAASCRIKDSSHSQFAASDKADSAESSESKPKHRPSSSVLHEMLFEMML